MIDQIVEQARGKELPLSSLGSGKSTRWSCRFDEDGGRILFAGPPGRIRAKLIRGSMHRDMCNALRALQFPGNVARMRNAWELEYNREKKKLLLSSPRGYLAIFQFYDAVPSQLLDVLRDVFVRREEPGSMAARRSEAGYSGLAARTEPPAKTGGFLEKYRRMKAEAPEKFKQLLTKRRAARGQA